MVVKLLFTWRIFVDSTLKVNAAYLQPVFFPMCRSSYNYYHPVLCLLHLHKHSSTTEKEKNIQTAVLSNCVRRKIFDYVVSDSLPPSIKRCFLMVIIFTKSIKILLLVIPDGDRMWDTYLPTKYAEEESPCKSHAAAGLWL